MIYFTLGSLTALLLMSSYLCIYLLLQAIVRRTNKRVRLTISLREGWWTTLIKKRFERSSVVQHISYMLETVWPAVTLSLFLQSTAVLLLVGLFTGSILFASLKAVCILTFIFGAAPYISLRMKLLGLQMKTRMEFLPAVEVFYQTYVLSSSKNIRVVLGKALQEQRILYPLKPIFEQLYRNLSTHRELEECFYLFRLSLGHDWAGYFANMLSVSIEEGVDITHNMKDLILDMRKAQRANQMERNHLLEIRIASFTPVLFLAVFMFINFRLNSDNAYYYYFSDASGRNMLLDAVLLIFAAFILGVYLSIRRM